MACLHSLIFVRVPCRPVLSAPRVPRPYQFRSSCSLTPIFLRTSLLLFVLSPLRPCCPLAVPEQNRRGVVEDRKAKRASHLAELDILREENVRLRQRVEELQELVDSQGPYAAAATTTEPAMPIIPRTGGSGAARLRKGSRDTNDTGREQTEAAGAGWSGVAGASASAAILRGQVAQLRRQVRLQWCAVDASAAVTQEVNKHTSYEIYTYIHIHVHIHMHVHILGVVYQ